MISNYSVKSPQLFPDFSYLPPGQYEVVSSSVPEFYAEGVIHTQCSKHVVKAAARGTVQQARDTTNFVNYVIDETQSSIGLKDF